MRRPGLLARALAAAALSACAAEGPAATDAGAPPPSAPPSLAGAEDAGAAPAPSAEASAAPIPSGLEGLVPPRSKDPPTARALELVLGKGAGKVVVGAWLEDVERELGPCRSGLHLPPTKTCAYPGWGVDVGLEGGRVARVSLYRAGRAMLGAAPSRGFRGRSREGVELGVTAAAAVAALGEPDERLAAQADPANDLWVWKARGVALELEASGGQRVVGAIHVPRAAGRRRE